MGFKIYLFALFVVYCSQGINASSEYELVTSDKTSKDQLQTLLQTLSESVEVEIDSAVQNYKHVLTVLDNTKNNELINALSELANAIITKTNAISEVVEIKKCIYKKHDEVVALVNATVKELKEIGETFGLAIGVVLYGVVTELSPFVDKFMKFASEFKMCGNVLCKVRVLTTAQETVEEAKSKIKELWTSIEEMMADVVPKLKELHLAIQKAVTKSTSIINEVSNCITDINEPHQ